LVVLNLYVVIKILVATFNTNHSVTYITQSITAAFLNFLILWSSQSAELAIGRVDVSGETVSFLIGLSLAVYILHVFRLKINNCWHLILYLT